MNNIDFRKIEDEIDAEFNNEIEESRAKSWLNISFISIAISLCCYSPIFINFPGIIDMIYFFILPLSVLGIIGGYIAYSRYDKSLGIIFAGINSVILFIWIWFTCYLVFYV